jgi:hypothetical protein
MGALFRSFAAFCLLITILQNQAIASDFDTQAGLESFIENFVLEKLPGPAGDVVSVVKNSPELVKSGLILWLNKRMAESASDALYDGNWEKHDRYMAFYTCIAKGDCSDLQRLAGEDAQTQSCDWTGTWIEGGAIDGASTMTLYQSGNTVTGTYTHNSGTINGVLAGNKLTGDWTETGSGGKFELVLSDDCNSFNGKWESRGTWGGPWTGTRQK